MNMVTFGIRGIKGKINNKYNNDINDEREQKQK